MERLVVGGSIAAIVVTILGLPFGTWDSTDFVLLVLVAAIVALVAVAMSVNSRNPGPLALIEAGAAVVLAVLAVWNFIEILFDLGQDDRGGIIGILFTVALAGAGVAVLVGAVNRLGGPRALGVRDGRGATVAAIGFVLVLVGWAANLSISYWTMAQASLSLAVLTVATVIILASRRVDTPIPVAWAGVALGVFGAILGFGQWEDLNKLGRERVELGLTDFGAFLIYAVGLVMVIVGGVMTALEQKPIQVAMDSAVETIEPADKVNRIE
jgi:drug/metabolite transporter (DMT)-like permease